MNAVMRSLASVRLMDGLSRGRSPIHALRPLAKLAATLLFLIAIASTGARDVVGLLPFALYPILVLALSDLPAAPIAARLAAVSPLVILVGALNPIFDRELVAFGGTTVAGGWLVFASIALRGLFAMSSALLLVATTGMDGLGEAMRALRLPKIFVLQTLLAYRYVSLLMEELASTLRAHELRSPGGRGVGKRSRGSLPGRLLVRTYERGARIHDAMLLRGFDGEYRTGKPRSFRPADFAYVAAWAAYFAAARFIDMPGALGALLVAEAR